MWNSKERQAFWSPGPGTGRMVLDLPGVSQLAYNRKLRTTKIVKELWHVSSRHNHWHSDLWNCFQLDVFKFPTGHKWFEQLPSRHNWSPIIPKFDMDQVSSPRTSQSSQFSISMPSSKFVPVETAWDDVASNRDKVLSWHRDTHPAIQH